MKIDNYWLMNNNGGFWKKNIKKMKMCFLWQRKLWQLKPPTGNWPGKMARDVAEKMKYIIQNLSN